MAAQGGVLSESAGLALTCNEASRYSAGKSCLRREELSYESLCMKKLNISKQRKTPDFRHLCFWLTPKYPP